MESFQAFRNRVNQFLIRSIKTHTRELAEGSLLSASKGGSWRWNCRNLGLASGDTSWRLWRRNGKGGMCGDRRHASWSGSGGGGRRWSNVGAVWGCCRRSESRKTAMEPIKGNNASKNGGRDGKVANINVNGSAGSLVGREAAGKGMEESLSQRFSREELAKGGFLERQAGRAGLTNRGINIKGSTVNVTQKSEGVGRSSSGKHFVDNKIVKEGTKGGIVKYGGSMGVLAKTMRWKVGTVSSIELFMERGGGGMLKEKELKKNIGKGRFSRLRRRWGRN